MKSRTSSRMQSRFENFSPSLLSPDSLVQFSSEITVEVAKAFPADGFISSSIAPIKSVTESANALLSRVLKGNMTELIHSSDKSRDKNYRRFVRFVYDQTDISDIDPTISADASQIAVVVDANPVNVNASYDEESAQLNRLFGALTPYQEQINRIGAKSRYDALRTEAAQFDTYRQGQSREQAEMVRGELAPVMKELAFELNALLSYLETQARRQQGAYETTAQLISTIVDRVMTPARANQTRKMNSRTESSAPVVA